ncbi:LuxR C-terminal-related transcriptional regulator [Erythrobacter sp.]|uniref:LuxR C-terminal-related transcriptional regulator n=1 Tax=Erythrobacter sp. TaxID=1042 RepID=UPI001B0FB9B4|nr:LuxR C-terminal-related transcriptional regulator [Erythrobacter sp.]MBO6527543.1 hypothetical protein [Erythrobacter sp.]MBO6530223.1 hypothetical protein [Erythrobacter sp.]
MKQPQSETRALGSSRCPESSAQVEWFIESKFEPGEQDIAVVPRQRLYDKILGEQLGSVVLVHGPAGFGKSLFMAGLYRVLEGADYRAAWLTLDEFDGSPEAFFSQLVMALQMAGIDMGSLPKIVSDALVGMDLRRGWQMLLHRLCIGTHEIVLFLDDYDRLASPAIDRIMVWLIARLPRHIHLVFGSRIIPDIGSARLQAQGKLRLIGPEDLKFDRDEASQLLGSEVPSATLIELQEKTDGWPVALSLARSYSQSKDPGAGLERFSGRSQEIAAYLADEVFSSLSGELQSFLIQTSFLERINGDLANRVCTIDNGWDLLVELERRSLFVTAIDAERRWFRYHHLIRENLAQKLAQSGELDLGILRKRAARWFFATGRYKEAFAYASKVADKQFLLELAEEGGGWEVALEHGLPAVKLMGSIPDPDPQLYPRVALAHIYAALAFGQVRDARDQLQRLASATKGYTKFSSDVARPCEIAPAAQVMAYFADFYDDLVIDTDEIRGFLEGGPQASIANPVHRAILTNMVCIAETIAGNYQIGLENGLRSMAVNDRIGLRYGRMYLALYVGIAYLELGKAEKAGTFFDDLSQQAQAKIKSSTNIYVFAQAFSAEAAYLQNRLEEASRRIDACFDKATHGETYFDVLWSAYSTAIALARLRGEEKAVEVLLDELLAAAESRGLKRLHQKARLRRVDERLRLGQRDKAKAAMRIAEKEISGTLEAREGGHQLPVWYAYHETRARLALAEGSPEKALENIAPALEAAQSRGHVRQLCIFAVLKTVASAMAGERNAALDNLMLAARHAVSNRFCRCFLDEPEESLAVLRETIAQNRNAIPEYRSELLQLLSNPRRPGGRPAFTIACANGKALSKTVTAREFEVLQYIADGLANKEIARECDVTEATVKFHRRNLYAKFGVGRRSQLIQRARSAGLL